MCNNKRVCAYLLIYATLTQNHAEPIATEPNGPYKEIDNMESITTCQEAPVGVIHFPYRIGAKLLSRCLSNGSLWHVFISSGLLVDEIVVNMKFKCYYAAFQLSCATCKICLACSCYSQAGQYILIQILCRYRELEG